MLAEIDDSVEKVHKAAKQGKWEVLAELLKKGFSMAVKDKFGKTPLHTACAWGQSEAVEWLVLVARVRLDDQDLDGGTALHLAVAEDNPEIVRFLVAKGASRAVRNKLGVTPGDLAHSQELKMILNATQSQPAKIFSDEPPPPYSFSEY